MTHEQSSTPISDDQALDRARAAHATQWIPVPGYPSPEDTVGNSYVQVRVENGWVFRPKAADTGPLGPLGPSARAGKDYAFYVVRHDGEFAIVPRERGFEAAAAVLLATV